MSNLKSFLHLHVHFLACTYKNMKAFEFFFFPRMIICLGNGVKIGKPVSFDDSMEEPLLPSLIAHQENKEKGFTNKYQLINSLSLPFLGMAITLDPYLGPELKPNNPFHLSFLREMGNIHFSKKNGPSSTPIFLKPY